MEIHEIVTALSASREPRASLYLNDRVIGSYFRQAVSAIREVVRRESVKAKVGASLLQLLGLELSGSQERADATPLDPLLMAILIEHEADVSRRLIDLSLDPPRAGVMVRHIGAASIIDIDQEVTAANSGLSANASAAVQRERMRQERRLQAKRPERKTIVWVVNAPWPMAAIASDEWVDDGPFASYGRSPPFGLLGRFESQVEETVFIAPFWIWHEG